MGVRREDVDSVHGLPRRLLGRVARTGGGVVTTRIFIDPFNGQWMQATTVELEVGAAPFDQEADEPEIDYCHVVGWDNRRYCSGEQEPDPTSCGSARVDPCGTCGKPHCPVCDLMEGLE